MEDSDDEDDDSDEEKDSPAKRLKKVRKMREYDRLDDEDLALIQEAQGLDQLPASSRPEPVERQTIVAKSEAELRKGLFYDSDGEQEGGAKAKDDVRKPTRVERYDEDGMDDFIDDDIGDQGDILASERRGRYDEEDDREINEAQLQEASDIFGTDYLEFMQEEEQVDDDEEELLGKKYRERGVGVDLGVDSDEEIISDDEDDDDLFGDDDDDMDEQKAEALRLKREKRKLDKAERRRQSLAKKTERRRAQLRRAFEPVQLVENFCTERDDEIRAADAPERFFDWKVPFHGSEADGMNEDEKQEATWIASRIPDIAQEFAAATSESQQRSILESIAYALRFMHRDKVEPAFIKRYRRDYVVSPAVRENLYAVQDEDGEWDRILSAREKVDSVIMQVTAAVDSDETTGVDAQKLQKLQDELEEAQAKLEDAAKQESVVKRDLEGLPAVDDDDDDELFGDSGGAAEVRDTV